MIAGVLSLLSLLLSWNRKAVAKSPDLRSRIRRFVTVALEATLTVLLIYSFLAALIFHHLPQPGGVAVLLILMGVGYGSKAFAGYYYGRAA